MAIRTSLVSLIFQTQPRPGYNPIPLSPLVRIPSVSLGATSPSATSRFWALSRLRTALSSMASVAHYLNRIAVPLPIAGLWLLLRRMIG